MAMKAKISIVTLGVRDLDRALAFYRDGLGFPVQLSGKDHVMFDMEGTRLFLYPRDKLAKDAGVPETGDGFSGVTIAHNTTSEAAADAVFAQAVAAGAREVKKLHKAFWGGYSGYFADPDGHLWEVAYNPLVDLT